MLLLTRLSSLHFHMVLFTIFRGHMGKISMTTVDSDWNPVKYSWLASEIWLYVMFLRRDFSWCVKLYRGNYYQSEKRSLTKLSYINKENIKKYLTFMLTLYCKQHIMQNIKFFETSFLKMETFLQWMSYSILLDKVLLFCFFNKLCGNFWGIFPPVCIQPWCVNSFALS